MKEKYCWLVLKQNSRTEQNRVIQSKRQGWSCHLGTSRAYCSALCKKRGAPKIEAAIRLRFWAMRNGAITFTADGPPYAQAHDEFSIFFHPNKSSDSKVKLLVLLIFCPRERGKKKKGKTEET